MCRIFLFFPLALMLVLESHAHENPTCAATVMELRALLGDPAFPLKWEEITMGDGKPLLVSIREKKGLLLLDFIKTREGPWAESTGAICKTGADMEIKFTGEQIRLGLAANWLVRLSLVNGGKFTLTKLGTEQLRIATHGWNGIFVPVK
jgi:hypothetical protein